MKPQQTRTAASSPNRATLLVAAAAVLGLLAVPIATAGTSGDPEAGASASVKKKLKKLKKRVKQLEQQVSGPAGGDLTGNYPDPSIAGGAVTNPKLGNDAVNSGKVAANSLTGADINEATLNLGLVGRDDISATNSNSPKDAIVFCPAGTRILSSGANIAGGTSGTAPNELSEVVITRSLLLAGDGVWVRAHETDSFAGNWVVSAQAICVPTPG
jgi:hypothetical protein